ncbi:MAG: hypothetical protein R3A44_30820 [Caldilineaceae bacterium]
MNINIQFGKNYKFQLKIEGFDGFVAAIQMAIWIGTLVFYLWSVH